MGRDNIRLERPVWQGGTADNHHNPAVLVLVPLPLPTMYLRTNSMTLSDPLVDRWLARWPMVSITIATWYTKAHVQTGDVEPDGTLKGG
jgi:hypothetical protein